VHADGALRIRLGTHAAARYLGITTRTLYRMIDEGEVPAYKMGRVLRLQRAELEAYLEGCRVKPGELGHLLPGRRG
jgi:excisionase family DNA binding protein